ncbi:MAG: YapH protein [Flaviaesturariibacter sp.]|nr:YapH protein [Flaviaesturariibacter sp.]
MKKRLFIALSLGLGFAHAACAQATASAGIGATIVVPINLAKTSDMNFGMIAAAQVPGAVELGPGGARSASNGVNLPSAGGSVSAASFVVSGESNYTYSITLPPSAVLTRQAGMETMTVTNFQSVPSQTGTLSAQGVQVLNVGARLMVGPQQAVGAYETDSPFEVVVNYN